MSGMPAFQIPGEEQRLRAKALTTITHLSLTNKQSGEFLTESSRVHAQKGQSSCKAPISDAGDIVMRALWIPLGVAVAAACALTLGGCGHTQIEGDVAAKHVLVFDGRGRMHLPGNPDIRLSPAGAEVQVASFVANWREAFREGDPRNLIIFIHGGLVGMRTGLGRVDQDLVDRILDDGNWYPLFIVWEADLGPTYWDHLWNMRRGEPWRGVMGKTLTPFIFFADIGGAVVRAPINWATSLANHLNAFPGFATPGMRDALAGHHELALRHCVSSEASIAVSIMGDRRSLGEEIHYALTGLITMPFKLVTLPLLDAIGTPAWNNMLRRTKMIFAEPFEEEIIMTPEEGRGALHLLARAIAEESAKDDGEVEITLVGHSMGAIIANEFIRHYPNLRYKNIVYMAAACSIQDFRDTVIPYLASAERGGQEPRFYNLMLHPRAEVRERYIMIPPLGLDVAPRGALLAWIDDIFGSQTTPLERTMGRWHNIMRLWQFIPTEIRHRVHFKTFGVEAGEPLSELTGFASICRLFSDSEHREWLGHNPQWHGDFSLMPWWDEQFWRPTVGCAPDTSEIDTSVSAVRALQMDE
jgi:hypothetical protein